MLKDIRGVQELRCASCGLASLRVTFSLRLLRRLDLADNRIEAVEDIEPHILRGLASLDLAGNRISKVISPWIRAVDWGFAKFQSAQRISLRPSPYLIIKGRFKKKIYILWAFSE